jgi:hypothetical protein
MPLDRLGEALACIPEDQRRHLEGYTPESVLRTYRRYRQLGWDDLGFEDTEKPNCVVVQPSRDHNGAFSHEITLDLIRRLREHYDVLLRIAHKESDAYLAMQQMPRPELIIIGGHGAPGALSFGEREAKIRAPASEELVLDRQDDEIGAYIEHATADAVVFLHSCHSKRLVDIIKRHAGGRTVIGADDNFSSDEIDVLSFYPFDIRIRTTKKLPLLPVHYIVEKTYKR